MEFRRGIPGRRQNRRICPGCKVPSGQSKRCTNCQRKTEARIEVIWYIDGKRKRELTHCWREQDAAAILQRKEEDYWRQQEFGVAREVGGTLREGIEAFKAQVAECSVDYKKQIDSALNPLAQGLGWDRPVTTLTAEHIERYKADGLAALSPTSVRSYLLVVRRLFSYLHEEGWIRRNPTRKIKLPAAKKGRDHLRPEEVGPVLSKFWEMAPDIAPIATALVLGGWRKGEIVNLRHQDVYLAERWAYVLDFEGDELTPVWTPKTESSRRAVPLHPAVVAALSRMERVTCPDGHTSPWVFPIMDSRKRRRYRDKWDRLQPMYGDRRSPSTTFLGGKLRAVLHEVGITRRVTVHGLRRTFAVLLQESGAPDAAIRQALGHGARGVTEVHYLPRRDETLKRWVDAIEVSIAGLSTRPRAPEVVGKIEQPKTPRAPEVVGKIEQPKTSGQPHCHQAATRLVANRPPYLRLVE